MAPGGVVVHSNQATFLHSQISSSIFLCNAQDTSLCLPSDHILTHWAGSQNRLAICLAHPLPTSYICAVFHIGLSRCLWPACFMHRRAGLWVPGQSTGLCCFFTPVLYSLDLIFMSPRHKTALTTKPGIKLG